MRSQGGAAGTGADAPRAVPRSACSWYRALAFAKPTADAALEARAQVFRLALQVQAYRATGSASYRDRAALTLAAYLEQQQPNGLFFHTARSPRHWRQLIDEPSAWVEASGRVAAFGRGVLVFAPASGVTLGWLEPAAYADAARRAWLGLVGYLDEAGGPKDVCIGSGEAYPTVGADRRAQITYYLEREAVTGDLHGRAPVLWAACALLLRSPLATEQGSPS